MSMLAEPRRKQKWAVDPRNSAWTKDDSKFGQKMLEKMGWSKGKGLGRTEQGSTDPIKVRRKNDNFGIGLNASHEDNWIAHQDDFNDLLAQLNNCHGQNSSSSSEVPQENEQKNFSLEEKSKTSKKRVHYMKFTKGKDLSSRTETDLNCIFGKRAKSTKDQEPESNSSDSQEETEEAAKTVTSALTMQEYFAKRMASMKKARASTEEISPQSDNPSPSQCTESSAVPKKKKKQKKKDKASLDDLEAVEENDAHSVTENVENQEKTKKKKTKRKKSEAEDVTTEVSTPPGPAEPCCDEMPPSKKKKKKKKKSAPDHREGSHLMNGHELAESRAAEPEVMEKKKARHQEMDSVGQLDMDEPVKRKKSKKKKATN